MASEKLSIIKNTFGTMEYGQNQEKVDLALNWFGSRKYAFGLPGDRTDKNVIEVFSTIDETFLYTIQNPEPTAVENLLLACEKNDKWRDIGGIDRMKLMNEFASEILKNSALISQIEICSRGLLSNETKRTAIPLLVELLEYYAAFALSQYQNGNESNGLAFAKISDENCLSAFGYNLGPALAAGRNIVIQTEPKITPIGLLLQEIALDVGIPEGTITVIPGVFGISTITNHPSVDLISIFDNLHKDEYNATISKNKKLIAVSPSKVPIIVFEGSDLDSACQSIIDAVWGYQGMLFWSAREILVQESVIDVFLDKFKKLLTNQKMGKGNNRLANLSYPQILDINQKREQLIKEANEWGFEIFTSSSVCAGDLFMPLVLIDGKLASIPALGEKDRGLPFATILSFRSINEAASLANNNHQGLAASVWVQNVNIVNEIVQKLNVSTVWINSFGLFSPEVSFSPWKASGAGYFGGPQGFDEFMIAKSKNKEDVNKTELNGKDDILKALNLAKQAEKRWSSLSRTDRIKKVFQILESIEKNQKSLSSTSLSQEWINDWKRVAYTLLNDQSYENTRIVKKDYTVSTYQVPKGIIAVETSLNIEQHNKLLILSALIEGNVVIILNESDDTQEFYSTFVKSVNAGVCNLVKFSLQSQYFAIGNKNIAGYFIENTGISKDSWAVRNSRKIWHFSPRGKNNVVLLKNVWCTSGESFL